MEKVETIEVKAEAEEQNEEKGKILESIKNSKPVSFVRRHAKGFVGGAVVTATAIAAAVAAGKLAADKGMEMPFDIDEIVDVPGVDPES